MKNWIKNLFKKKVKEPLKSDEAPQTSHFVPNVGDYSVRINAIHHANYPQPEKRRYYNEPEDARKSYSNSIIDTAVDVAAFGIASSVVDSLFDSSSSSSSFDSSSSSSDYGGGDFGGGGSGGDY